MDSELRYQTTSGAWVLFSPKRGSKKPSDFKKREERKKVPAKGCPFENPQKSGNAQPSILYPDKANTSNWEIQVIENRFPALSKKIGNKKKEKTSSLYLKTSGFGYHDILITREHNKNFSDLNDRLALEVLNVMKKRYDQVSDNKAIKYISLFQNWGVSAGASIYHPHYQIISLPIVPSDVERSLNFSEKYFKENNQCVYCQIIKEEIKNKKRIVFQNKEVVAFCPFASQEPFQVNIFPKNHLSFFEDTPEKTLKEVSRLLKRVLSLMKKNLNDPDYNWFIHTAPVFDKKFHHHYHWHIEILPKTNISAGFELGTGIEINPVFPEEAAKKLKTKY